MLQVSEKLKLKGIMKNRKKNNTGSSTGQRWRQRKRFGNDSRLVRRSPKQ